MESLKESLSQKNKWGIEIPGGYYLDESHQYRDRNGRRVISVTQIFALLGLVDYDHIRAEVLERKSALGVAVHAAVQYLCEGTLDWDSVSEEAMPYVVAAETWMKKQEFISESQEGKGLCEINGMSFGFTYDHLGTIIYKGKRRKAILDLKTCVAESATWKLQTAAYALAAPKLPPGEKYLRIILQLKKDGTFKPYYYEDNSDESAFKYFLFCALWAINNEAKTLD